MAEKTSKYHHVHISAEAHEKLKEMADKKKTSIKVVVDELLAKIKK